MKYILTSALFFIFSISIYPQWTPQNSGTNQEIKNLYFLNENLGWVCGDDGTILKTINGGIDWISQNISTLDNVHDIFFSDSITGWAVLFEFYPYRHASIIHTTNSGDSWNVQLSINDYTLHSIHFTDENNGWTAGSNGIVFHTTNGGGNWYQQYPPTGGGWLWPIFFLDENVGWTAGDPLFGVFKSTNGGNSWQSYPISVNERIYSLIFLDYLTGWVAAAHGGIAKSTDGGITWENVQSGTSQYLRDIFFIDFNKGWCVGHNGTIIHTTNGGISWNSQASNTDSDLRSVQFINDHIGWAVGTDGVILKYDTDLSFINLISPNGGEILTSGSTYFIEWGSQNVVDVTIEYSTDNGNNWISIVDSIVSAGIYEWTIPNTLTTEGRVRISDLSDPNTYDISDGSFTIQSSKIIMVVSPNGGEILEGGSNYEILWSSNDVEYVKLEYSINNGVNWNLITDSIGSTGIYLWSVPNVLTTQARIKISDVNISSIYDISDEPFRINYIVGVKEDDAVETFNLEQNFPNPFNPMTTVKYQIPEKSLVTVKVYDVLGNEIETLVNEGKKSGSYEITWYAEGLPSGVYFYQLKAGSYIETKKMLLMK